MDIFTRLAQQTTGGEHSDIAPRLLSRFEDAHADEGPAAADASHDAAIESRPLYMSSRPLHIEERATYIAPRSLHIEERAAYIAPRSLHIEERDAYIEERGAHMPSYDVAIESRPLHMPSRPLHIEEQGDVSPLQVDASTIDAPRSVVQARTDEIRPAAAPLQITPAQIAAPTPQPVTSEPPAAPVIQVRIGRVEVRAVTRAPETPRREQEREQRPRSTLESYLRKGNRER